MDLKKYAAMSSAERAAAVEDLGRKAHAPRNGQGRGIDARILAYEAQYGMTSAVMRERFAAGDVRDTVDTSSWLMLLRARER